ncbi:LL-diaminopimelate aminotransferase [Desulfococcaceae bacterium HSG7]|nr:LL-diaminopimelate aminotransferase [Desulfococcaceae bacterium HSG7]
MIRINENYLKLQASYLFSDIAKRVAVFQQQNTDIEVIKLGIGDVTFALPQACIQEFHRAIDEMAVDSSFRGYGPEQGYDFLRTKIAENDFKRCSEPIAPDEIFVSDGAKCDTGNFQEIFNDAIKIAIPDPVYPVYVDTNVMAGRSGLFKAGRYDGFLYLESGWDNDFVPNPPDVPVDLIYLCFPNNPTGAVITKTQLQEWVDYAREHRALILFDAAYEAFIRDDRLPHSIYEIDGAREVAIEFRSFSKTAGFTGTRCAYTVVPKNCMGFDAQGKGHSLHNLWNRRHTTKFNSVSYPVQRAAAAVYTEAGQVQVKKRIDYYLNNAAIIRQAVADLGFKCVGGVNSPYIWIDGQRDSWEFFDLLLNKAGVVCTPGAGFGLSGKPFIRISAFNTLENVQKAMGRVKNALA